jgi:hypothetical protein
MQLGGRPLRMRPRKFPKTLTMSIRAGPNSNPGKQNLCAADWFSGSNYRRARGQRENHANTQSALLWGRGPEAFGPRWREAAKATGWPGQRAQAPPRRSPQRRLSLGEQGETSTRFRSTKVQLIQSRHLRGEKREAPALGRGPLRLGRKRPRRARRDRKFCSLAKARLWGVGRYLWIWRVISSH